MSSDPADVRPLRFTANGIGIGAHLRLPQGPPPYPGVVLVDGSGARTRHDYLTHDGAMDAAMGERDPLVPVARSVADPDSPEGRRRDVTALERMAAWAAGRVRARPRPSQE